MNYRSTAATVAVMKASHPERYCPERRCLWMTEHGGRCPRHGGALCAVCRKPLPETDRLPFGKGVAHAACAMRTTINQGRADLETDLALAESALMGARRAGEPLGPLLTAQAVAIAALSKFNAVHGVGSPS